MSASDRQSGSGETHLKRPGQTVRVTWETTRRAFAEFLTIPSLIIAGFLLLAVVTAVLDHEEIRLLRPVRTAIREHVFGDGKATSDLLGTIAGSIITVTSITFSLLLLAVQQAAAALTAQVYDQFLRRRVNQAYFGFFVGLALYTLVILATVDPPYNPIFGASMALLMTLVALHLMILLLYTTINQMRPVVVVEAIHDHTLKARECQRALLRKTRRSARSGGAARTPVRTSGAGYVVRVDVDALGAAADKARGDVEVVLLVSIGSFVAFEDTIAEVRSPRRTDVTDVVEAARAAVHLERQRDLDTDPAYGIEQLAMIGWTSVSTSKSNPAPGLLVIRGLRNLLARWSAGQPEDTAEPESPVVYTDDVLVQLLDAFESLAVVASESMQHQTMAEIARTFAIMYDRLPGAERTRTEDLILRILSGLGDHVLTGELNAALTDLIDVLSAAGRRDIAAKVQAAQEALGASVGKLGSRATRVPVTG